MKQFLKQTAASTLGTLLALCIFLGLSTFALIVLAIGLASISENSIKNNTILSLNLSDLIKDSYSNKNISQILTGNQRETLKLWQLTEAIENAASDKKIKAIFLDGRNVNNPNGYANLSEIRTALTQFKKSSGKKIIAYANDWNEKNYYLASVADQIILNPIGTIEINGLASEPIFFAGALQKYGVGVQVVRVGSYKSAVEPYLRSNLSPENKEQLQKLLGDIWQNFLNTVGNSRNITSQHLQQLSDNSGILSADQAKSEKLVDTIGYYDTATSLLKKISNSNDENFAPVDIEKYIDLNKSKKANFNKIAVIYAEGTITDGKGDRDEIAGERFAKEIRKLSEKKDVKGVVLRINSPGGSATASDVILREIKRLQQKKPVVISMGNTAASGGYWIATGGQYIFAQDNTITGSIGVFGMLLNLQKLANNNGITWDVVKTGKLADINTNSRPKTAQELAIYQKQVNYIYDLFLDKVASSRHLDKEKVKTIAQGRVWSGQQAQKIGLVDQIGGLDQAIKYTAKLAKLGNNWQLQEYPQVKSWTNTFFETIPQSTINSVDTPVTQTWKMFEKNWLSLNDPQGVYLFMPYDFNIR
ncbi:MAG: signal peptide peptidase SppA [Cyanobacteriota bacterium ELA615]